MKQKQQKLSICQAKRQTMDILKLLLKTAYFGHCFVQNLAAS